MSVTFGKYALLNLFIFFQAEDGIRDATVTGVQTCALPICRISAAASVVGLRSGSADQTSHHSVAQVLKGSRPRRRPCQVPRRISRRFSAARSLASSGVSTVLPP